MIGAAIAIALAGLAGGAGQGSDLPVGRQHVNLNPADFTTKIDNPYYPLRAGDRKVWRETAPDGTRQKIVDQVTNRTKVIADGIRARVVLARVTNRAGQV